MKRLLPIVAVALVALANGIVGDACAQGWPAKPVKVVIPLTAGSATDVMARIVFDQVGQQVGHPFIIENRPGAGNSIGMNAVAKADPEGVRSELGEEALAKSETNPPGLPKF